MSSSWSPLRADLRRLRAGLAPGVLAVAVIAAMLWVIPSRARNPLWESAVWSFVVLVSLAGWGSAVRLAIGTTARVDLGLRIAWGAGLVCFAGGALMVPALMVRTTALVLVELGVVLALAALALEGRAVSFRARVVSRLARAEPAVAAAALLVGAAVMTQCLAAIADWHTNPYDDDIAYLAFAKKLSDTGTVLEPFSFRRLSAYGGQTLFLEIVGIRAAPSQGHTFDRCVCFVWIVLLMLGYRRNGRRPSAIMLLATILMLATMPSIAINTASYWSGVAFFLALFRTMVWAEEDERSADPARPVLKAAFARGLPIALVAAGVCTLRQNYLAVPVLVLGASYAVRLRRGAGTIGARLAEPAAVGLLSLVFLAPWFIVSWQSSRTFLYPVMLGTFNPALALNASAWNLVREIAVQAGVWIDGLPLRTMGLFLLAIVLVRERSPRIPLWALCIGSFGGFVALVHGFTQSDAQNIGRYAFAFMIALAIAIALTASTARPTAGGRSAIRSGADRLAVAAAIVFVGVAGQLVLSREQLAKDWTLKFHNIENMHYGAKRVRESDPPQLKMYERLQNAVPAGERLAVLVDEPYWLDFARNPIWNLDMPGYASLPPGLPSFQGSEAIEGYLRGLGIRWFMFVLPETSRYHYRREYFLELFVNEQEIWRAYAPYLVDFIDAEMEIRKRHREVYAERGVVVLDLGEPRPADQVIVEPPPPPPGPAALDAGAPEKSDDSPMKKEPR